MRKLFTIDRMNVSEVVLEQMDAIAESLYTLLRFRHGRRIKIAADQLSVRRRLIKYCLGMSPAANRSVNNIVIRPQVELFNRLARED